MGNMSCEISPILEAPSPPYTSSGAQASKLAEVSHDSVLGSEGWWLAMSLARGTLLSPIRKRLGRQARRDCFKHCFSEYLLSTRPDHIHEPLHISILFHIQLSDIDLSLHDEQ